MFISFEGVDGAGKTTLIREIETRLAASGETVIVTREPGAGPLGKRLREILLDDEPISPRAELFLFLADRAEHMSTLIAPALARGEFVLCDRHADSTVVYQGHGRGLDLELLRQLNSTATGGVKPQLTFVLDLDADVARGRQLRPDRIGAEGLEFFQRVRQGFLAEAAHEPARFCVLDASLSPVEVAHQAWKEIERRRLLRGES